MKIGQKRTKQRIIEEQTGNEKVEIREVHKNIPNYSNSNISDKQSVQRVAVFGIDTWKKIIGDRTISNLQDIAVKIKNAKDRELVQANGIDSMDPYDR